MKKRWWGLIGLTALAGAATAALGLQYLTQRPFVEAAEDILASRTGIDAAPPFGETMRAWRNEGRISEDFGPAGASPARSDAPQCYDVSGRPLPAAERGAGGRCILPAFGRYVAGAAALRQAMATAKPGDTITLAPGVWPVSGQAIYAVAGGLPGKPIVLRAARLGDATLQLATAEGFAIAAPNWIVENLVIVGTCEKDDWCEHAFHITGKAENVVIRNNRIRNFNSAIKANGKNGDWTDRLLVEGNTLSNDKPRDTGYPVTTIDVVGASDVRIVGNVIADFAKKGADRRSYAAFVKGNGANNRIERNLVICEWQHSGGFRAGLSLGGGGTGEQFCRGGSCPVEDSSSVIASNVVSGCSDVGVYLREARDARVENNLLHATRGVDLRFAVTNARIANNVIDGRVMAWNGSRAEEAGNVESRLAAARLKRISDHLYASAARGDFRAPVPPEGVAVKPDIRDFCGMPMTSRSAGPFSAACLPAFPGLD
jgi:Right handed beta helix region